jgi:tetratricopeptide (TPR) repeat protein
MQYNPSYAIAAMREVLKRDPQRLEENYDVFLSMSAPYPDLMNNLRTLSRLNNRLRLKVLPGAQGKDAEELISGILEEDPELSSLTPRQKEEFFRLWAAKVSQKTVLKALEENPGWRQYGWRVIAADLVQKGDFETACKMAERSLSPSGLPIAPVGKTVRELERDARLNPTDFSSGVYLLQAYKDDLRLEEALQALEKLQTLPTATDQLLRERAYILSHLERFEEAWEFYGKWDASPLSKQ